MGSSQILALAVFVVVLTITTMIVLASVGYVVFRVRARAGGPAGVPDDEPSLAGPYFFERVGAPGAEDPDEPGAAPDRPRLAVSAGGGALSSGAAAAR